MFSFDENNEIILPRTQLKNEYIDIQNRTLIVGFNEPKFKKSKKELHEGDIDSKLNARFISYFLPAVEIAKMQKKRPRFFIVSGINMALQWNAENEEQKKVMMANNNIKIDFLRLFFEKFFPNEFSLIEFIIPQDTLKVPESKIIALWNIIETKHPAELQEIRFQLTKFIYPKIFNVKTYKDLSRDQLEKLYEVDATIAFKYAIGHLFALGDISFEGNYIHNPYGYVSFGGEAEAFFNIVRDLAYKSLKDFGSLLFNRKFVLYENFRIVLENEYKVPPAYNGMFHKKELMEVTYENQHSLDFYDSQAKLTDQMNYMYDNLLSKKEYQKFWNDYKTRYFDLKERYKESYEIKSDW